MINEDISNLNKTINLFDKKQKSTESQLEQLEQYDRRENLEIHGVLQSRNECTKLLKI